MFLIRTTERWRFQLTDCQKVVFVHGPGDRLARVVRLQGCRRQKLRINERVAVPDEVLKI